MCSSDLPLPSKTKWSGVQNFNNIQYNLVASEDDRAGSKKKSDEIKVTVQRAFGIGPGEAFRWSKLNTSKDDIVPIDISVRHDNPKWQTDSFDRGINIRSLYSILSIREFSFTELR